LQLAEIAAGQIETELVYLREMNSRKLEVKVLKIVPEKRTHAYLILDRTIFHPKGGGQPSDRGIIRAPGYEVAVKKAIYHNGVVVHWGKLNLGSPSEGDATCEIDWEYRHLVMRRHTSAHLLDHCLAEVTSRRVETTESWLDDPCYVGYAGSPPDAQTLRKTEGLANRMIEPGGEVRIEFLKRDVAKTFLQNAPNYERLPDLPEIRTVTIKGCEPIPCGGTHVSDLTEIGKISVVRAEQMPNESFRLHFSVGASASST
jgi:alanyl-tRNA synthetase